MPINRNELLQELARLGYPIPDANGNLQAQVTPRTGTLAELLAVADAGEGEIATATDIEAQVMYHNGEAKPFVRAPSAVISAFIDEAVTSIAAGADWKVVPLTGSNESAPQNLVDVASASIILPSWIAQAPASLSKRAFLRVEMAARFLIFAATAGTTYTGRFEAREAGGAWVAITADVEATVPTGDTSIAPQMSCDVILPIKNLLLFSEFRMVIKHDAGVAEGSYQFSNFVAHKPISLVVTRLEGDPDFGAA